jgi:hypothetical protein
MTDKVHGGVRGGEFLTGKMDFFTISTLVPVAQTNVVTPSADLYQISSTVWTPVDVVDGSGATQTYGTKAAYNDAFAKQANLDTVLKVFALRANPVAVSVSTASESDPSAVGFGSSYSSTKTVATINIATEKSGLWFAAGQGNLGSVAMDSNESGYMLVDAMEGVVVKDLASTVLHAAVIDTADATYTNTLVARRVAL